MTLSLCMIVKDEEKVLERCLSSVCDIVDEIIIVDTGSTDKTKDIAKKFTDKVYNFKWIDDFSKARNYSFSKATKDYIMWLDADDIILEEDRKKLKELKLNDKVDIYFMKYNIGFDEDENVTFSYYRERILKRQKNYKWVGAIHEVIVPKGECKYLDIAITHKKINKRDNKRNLRIFEKIIKSGEKLDPRQEFYYARELYYNALYDSAIKRFENFLKREDGFVENKISACLDLHSCYIALKQYEMAAYALTKSFIYDMPKAEVCCKLGDYFMWKKLYVNAKYWYERALEDKLDMTKGGFYNIDYYNYIPHIQLCVCLYNLKEFKLAYLENEKAGKYKPNSKIYIHNKKFFEENNLLEN